MCGPDADTILFLPVNARKRGREREGPICVDYYFKDIISHDISPTMSLSATERIKSAENGRRLKNH